MNPNDKHSLVNDIYFSMQTTRTEEEMKQIFRGYNIDILTSQTYSADQLKEALRNTNDDILLQIAEDLGMLTTEYTQNTKPTQNRNIKEIFICHAKKDKEIISDFIQLLEGTGISSDQIFCSSVEGYGTSLGTNFEDDIKKRLNDKVLVLFMISENFYNSTECLIQMGATWALTKDQISIAIPPFELSQMKGVFQKFQGIRINEGKQLDLLKETLEDKLSLTPKRHLIWERTRNMALRGIQSHLDNISFDNFSGTYKGKQLCYYIPGEEKDKPCKFEDITIDVTMILVQTGNQVTVTAFYKREGVLESSSSESDICILTKTKDQQHIQILYHYTNEGNPNENLDKHSGTAILKVIKKDNDFTLKGNYYTNRLPFPTRGKFQNLKRVSKDTNHPI